VPAVDGLAQAELLLLLHPRQCLRAVVQEASRAPVVD
jgi:hypothetical protein